MARDTAAPDAWEGGDPGRWPPPALADRRRARSARTRRKLVEALSELLADGRGRPTERDVADRAGVSLRTLQNHFRRLDDLYLSTVEALSWRYSRSITLVPARGPVVDRLRTVCRQRRQVYEAVGPVLATAFDRFPDPSATRQALAPLQARLRLQLATALAPELAARGGPTELLLDTLELSAGWATWRAMRHHADLSAEAAERRMAYAIGLLLS